VKPSGVTNTPSNLLLDAWPIMEWIQGKEPAASGFAALIESAILGETRLSMSRINHGEVVYLIRKNFSPELAAKFLNAFSNLPIVLLSVSDRLIDAAVEFKSNYRISFADAFAAAQAVELSVPLLTGDPDFLPLISDGGPLRLHWIGA